MSPEVAPFGHAAMSELSLLSGVNRTSRLRPPTSEFDPGCVKTRTTRECAELFSLFSLLLQRHQNTSVIGQRCAGLSPGSADWNHRFTGDTRRTSSSLRQGLGFRYTHLLTFDCRLFRLPDCAPVIRSSQNLPRSVRAFSSSCLPIKEARMTIKAPRNMFRGLT